MNRKKVDSKLEENIITTMITSKEYLSQVVPVLDLDLLKADHFKLIAKWCISYFNKYKKAPGKHIENRYHSWVSKGRAKEETVEAIHDILEKLSDNYDSNFQNNIPYLIDEAAEYLKMRKMELLRDNLDSALVDNDLDLAEKAVNSHSTVSLGMGVGVDTFLDEKAWENAYSELSNPLFSVGTEEVNSFFGNAFVRDGLIGILGPEKRGKTYWCYEFGNLALMNHRRVATFQVGDLSERQSLKRIGTYMSRKPMFKKDCGEIKIPIKILKRDDRIKIKHKTIICETPVTKEDTKRARKAFMRRFGLSPNITYHMLSTHANSSINIAGIEAILNQWEMEKDFIPDVIIIDYPDILAAEPNCEQYSARDKINETWKALRRLSQERHCLVIAPTQADAMSYDTYWLTAKNFSEDKRKLAHVTGLLGLNQTEQEKEIGIMRLNWIVLREADFSTRKGLYVGQCLKLGRAFCCGYY